ncbi:MAG TPA: hypothetical protein VEK07_12180 [Polyangiaceae bacterium]|nr:hypothetical protein [Polyangiaceae bacterium]
MENRFFFPQTALDQWISDGSAELRDGQLTLAAGRRFSVAEALRVLREVSGLGDELELVGRVKTREQLAGIGAEIVETSMLIGDAAYDVEPGWVGVPIGTFVEHFAAQRRNGASEPGDGAPRTDEELIVRFARRGGRP